MLNTDEDNVISSGGKSEQQPGPVGAKLQDIVISGFTGTLLSISSKEKSVSL
jgi:hypothetical protein